MGGIDSSYYAGRPSTALHTGICSSVATSPNWSRLGKADREALARDGRPLWHLLLEELRPQTVALSVERSYLDDIVFDATTDRRVIHTVRRKVDGALRWRPYNVEARWYNVGSEPSLFVFGPAAQTPFGTLAADHKQRAGSAILAGGATDAASFGSRIPVTKHSWPRRPHVEQAPTLLQGLPRRDNQLVPLILIVALQCLSIRDAGIRHIAAPAEQVEG